MAKEPKVKEPRVRIKSGFHKKPSFTSRIKQMTFEGLPLVDATQDVEVQILPSDVEISRKKDPSNCAAAKAGQREFQTDVRVFMSRVYVKDPKKPQWIRFVTPMAIQKEIVSFDRGAEFQPGVYKFKAPPPSEKQGYQYKGSGGGDSSNNPGNTRGPRRHTANVRMNAHTKMALTTKKD